METRFTESIVKDAALDLPSQLSYTVIHGGNTDAIDDAIRKMILPSRIN